MEIEIRKPFSRTRVQTEFKGESLTKGSLKDSCDINKLMNKYRQTGLIDHVNTHQGSYADLSELVDYQTALNIVHDAQEAFESLPSSIRRKFDNDPGEFLAFVDNPDNVDSMREMGLLPPLPSEEPVSVEPDSSPAPDSNPDAT